MASACSPMCCRLMAAEEGKHTEVYTRTGLDCFHARVALMRSQRKYGSFLNVTLCGTFSRVTEGLPVVLVLTGTSGSIEGSNNTQLYHTQQHIKAFCHYILGGSCVDSHKKEMLYAKVLYKAPPIFIYKTVGSKILSYYNIKVKFNFKLNYLHAQY